MTGLAAKTMKLLIRGQLAYKLFLFGLLILSSCIKNNIKSEEMNLVPGDTLAQVVLQTEGNHINGLRLSIKGEIKGAGQLSFGDSDSTFYQTYELKNGKIEITYDADWYSEFCYLTFKPTTGTEGKLKFEADFHGD